MESVVSDTNGLLISDFSSSTRGERHSSYYANHPQRTVHLVMFKISVGRDPKNSTTSSTAQIQLYALIIEKSTLCLYGPILTLNWLFFKIFKFSKPSFPGMMSSALQPHFTSGGLLWQWWLSYLFRTSVNCTNWLYTWALKPNSSKPNQTEW